MITIERFPFSKRIYLPPSNLVGDRFKFWCHKKKWPTLTFPQKNPQIWCVIFKFERRQHAFEKTKRNSRSSR